MIGKRAIGGVSRFVDASLDGLVSVVQAFGVRGAGPMNIRYSEWYGDCARDR